MEITNAGSAWAAFKDDNGPDVNNLAMNLYLESSEKEQRGFEFTHKSFGEYLTARALLSVAEGILYLADRRIEHALVEWVAATRSGNITSEILRSCAMKHACCVRTSRMCQPGAYPN